MYISPHEQGSDEWLQERLGIATASCFDKIMTSKTCKRAKTDYIYLLAAEAITQKSQEAFFDNEHMQRGRELESCAIALYEIDQDIEVAQVGLCKKDVADMIGFSPDGIIRDELNMCDGGLEIKCPQLKKHLQYHVENKIPDQYVHQVFGCMYLSECEYWDFMSYSEDYPPFYIRTSNTNESYLKWVEGFEKVWPEFKADLIKLIEMKG